MFGWSCTAHLRCFPQKSTLRRFSKASWWLNHVLEHLRLDATAERTVREALDQVEACRCAYFEHPPGFSLGSSAACLFVVRRILQNVQQVIAKAVEDAVEDAKFPVATQESKAETPGLVSSKPPAGLSKKEKRQWHRTKMLPVDKDTQDVKRGRGTWYSLSKRQQAVKQLQNPPKMPLIPYVTRCWCRRWCCCESV